MNAGALLGAEITVFVYDWSEMPMWPPDSRSVLPRVMVMPFTLDANKIRGVPPAPFASCTAPRSEQEPMPLVQPAVRIVSLMTFTVYVTVLAGASGAWRGSGSGAAP